MTQDSLDAKLLEEAYANMRQLTQGERIAVVPGFYGVTSSGEVAVFPRGGSDLTGGEIAKGLSASCYENWTDVSGVFEVDPRLVSEARAIPRLTFKEIRLSERVPEEGVVGIARLDNIAYIYMEKDMLGEEIGFTADLLGILRDFNIQTYHFPTDKDDIAVLVNQEDLTGTINDLRRRIEEKLNPDLMNVAYNLSVLTPVGLGLYGNSYPGVEALGALGKAHIPIEMIDQSPSQICFHIGVQQSVADDALRILYTTLIG